MLVAIAAAETCRWRVKTPPPLRFDPILRENLVSSTLTRVCGGENARLRCLSRLCGTRGSPMLLVHANHPGHLLFGVFARLLGGEPQLSVRHEPRRSTARYTAFQSALRAAEQLSCVA